MGNGLSASNDCQALSLTVLSVSEREMIGHLRSMQEVARTTIENAARIAALSFPRRMNLRLVGAAPGSG